MNVGPVINSQYLYVFVKIHDEQRISTLLLILIVILLNETMANSKCSAH